MLAVRKLPPRSAAQWEEANLAGKPFDELPIALIKEWMTEDNKVSLYVIDHLDKLTDVAMALTMVTGLGPKGSQFFVLDLQHLKDAGLEMHQTKGLTQCGDVDKLHYDVSTRRGGDLRKLIEAFVARGEIRAADQVRVLKRAVDAVRGAEYDIPGLAAKLKDPVAGNEVQKVCNSAVRLIGAGELALG